MVELEDIGLPREGTEDAGDMTDEIRFRRKIMIVEYEFFDRRVNMSLLSESMLIISYVSSLNLWKDFQGLVILINALGFSITFLYAHVLIRQALIVENHRKFLIKNDSTFKKYKTERTRGISSNYILGFFLPIVLLITWILLFFFVTIH